MAHHSVSAILLEKLHSCVVWERAAFAKTGRVRGSISGVDQDGNTHKRVLILIQTFRRQNEVLQVNRERVH